jgi:competence protein ComEC
MSEQNTPTNFTFYPLLWLAICFLFGILIANFLNINWQICLIGSFLFGILTAIFIKQTFSLVFISLAFIAIGGLCFQVENQQISSNRIKRILDEKRVESGEPVEIEGVLRGNFDEAVGGFFIEVETEKLIFKNTEQKVSGNIRFFAPIQNEQTANEYERLDLQYGARIRVACSLVREDNFQNPGVISRKEILDQQGIDATATIKSSLLIEKIGNENNFAPFAGLYEVRRNLIRDFREKFSISTAGIMIASLLGNKYFLDRLTAELFREGGTFHVLVISGLHITFIGGLTLLFLRFFTRKRLWQFIIASAFLWAYSIAVGADVPVIRATIMFTVLLFSQVVYRKGNLLNSLGLCALILLVWRPNDLFSQSFQLTFISVLAIIVVAFPLIENLRAIGEWRPSAETPFPPNVPNWLKRFCETIYWREKVWEFESKQNIWSVNLFKSPYLKVLESKGLQGICRYLFEGILVSLIVQIWLFPLTVYYFHRVSVASILLNLWVGFFIAFESFAALTALFFAKFSAILALPLIKLTEIFNWLLLSLPNFFVENNWASFRVPVYSGNMKAVYFLYFAPVMILTFAMNKWNPFALISNFESRTLKKEVQANFPKYLLLFSFSLLLLFSFSVVFHPFSAPRSDGKLHVDFLDVGQGDATFITFPNGETMLVDGGGKPNFNDLYVKREGEEPEIFEPDVQGIGEAVVSQFLWEKGYAKIDYILATHADADHLQGLVDVAKNFRVKAAIFGRMPEKDEGFIELSNVLTKRKIEILKFSKGDNLEIGSVKIEVLNPSKEDSPEAISDNNHSIVLRLVFGEKKILLTGDIEKETESRLLQNPEFLQADLIKVAHHGSRTSSTEEFVTAVNAEFAIISVGKKSLFGHPHGEVVERWQRSGAGIMKTGEKGTIFAVTDGIEWEFGSFILD